MTVMTDRAVEALRQLPADTLGCPIYDTNYDVIVRTVIEALRQPSNALRRSGLCSPLPSTNTVDVWWGDIIDTVLGK